MDWEQIRKRDVYPCVIVKDRYGGTYSGAAWVAWNEYEHPEDPECDDVTCSVFWAKFEGVCGKGATPTEAYESLIKAVEAKSTSLPTRD